MRFKYINDLHDHLLKNLNCRYNSRYCIIKVTLLHATEVGHGFVNRLSNIIGPPIVRKSVLRSTFTELPGKIAILHGLTHKDEEIYKGKGAQNVANCVMNIAMKKVHSVKTWLRSTLDEILMMGDSLYAKVKSEKPAIIKMMTAADLDNTKFQIEDRKLVIDVDLITMT
ncbi:PREDICTED: uncharacterized protein LOC108765829, partial [Trachymyrmex cornetzi]|uniref:uncharacterized protein LOC108765829 n=1 Tax=Trachymyrmex cornetzi TaxID=471704 RepID=UPI00084F5700